MPTGYSDWKEYADGFPEAFETISSAVTFLKEEQGVDRVFLFGHSMGARMSSAFVSQTPSHGLSGLIVAGCRNNGGHPLACDENLKGVDIPVLDVWGAKNGKDSRAASERKSMISMNYTQVKIPGANHKFEGQERQLVEAVATWLNGQN
jgi:pimeloyl-ACP methyl ester carboxylesterase